MARPTNKKTARKRGISKELHKLEKRLTDARHTQSKRLGQLAA
ncbi:MAG: hypothetical protein QOG32_1337, partial [Chloroflexota bacterium]|nr:hypothetical protein [Chloroflexota bacterium]